MSIKNIKILLIDDPAKMRNTIKSLIKELGYGQIIDANYSSNTLATLQSMKIDLIISDWLPENRQLFTLMKEEIKKQSIPIIIISSEAKREYIVESAELGVKGYLVTPINRKILQEKIEKIFNKVK